MTKNRLISIVLTLIMLFTMAIPLTANAQVSYDPQAEGNHGIYIDTFKVPNDNNISVSSDGKTITAKRNVVFKLYCSVDASWDIQAADASNTSVDDGDVFITIGGDVVITDEAKGGNYTITATAENVTNVDTATIKLSVDSKSAPARAESIVFDGDEMDNPQMTVSQDGKTLTIDGKVTQEKLAVKYTPEYLYDNQVSFTSTSSEAYELSGRNNSYITSFDKVSDAILKCSVGTENSDSVIQTELKVVINEKSMNVDFTSDEIQGNYYNYTVALDQKVHFNVISNQYEALPERYIENIKWTLRQDNQELVASGTKRIDGINYNIFNVYGSDGIQAAKVASIYVSASNISDSIIVETEKSTAATTVGAVTLSGRVSTDYDNAGNDFYLNTVTLNFNILQVSAPSKAFIDFEKAGLEQDVDYAVKEETLGGVKTRVYYFEADGKNLNLSEATFGDVPGVRSFEESKDEYFANGQTYKVNYEFSDLADSVFGSAGTAKMFNNSKLKASELDSSSLLINNNVFTKQGTGYKVLTVQCMRGTTEISKVSYVLRFVSASSELNKLSASEGLKISKNSSMWYATWFGEVVHIRRGEAVVPGFYKYNSSEGRYEANDAISIYDPYVEYSVSDAQVASTTPNTDGTYRINGLEDGVITVTAVGAVNKENEATFEIYVNKDIYEGRFEIIFTDAITNRQMSSAFAVNGKQTDMPVNTNALEANMGIPVLTWSLDCDPSIATINPETGAITTKTSCSEKITVTATSSSGKYSDSKTFTIADVEGKGIVTLAEKVVDNVSVVTPTGTNAGTCKVGNTFTLYPSSYSPVNATRLSGTVTWSSSNPDIATVDNGVVTALAETAADNPVRIIASYTPTSDGIAVETVYNLTISGFANPIQGISANSLTFDNPNALAQSIDLTFTPSETPNKMVTYLSSDTNVATVSENGLVTPVGAGICTITITSVADPTVTTTVQVTVNGPVATECHHWDTRTTGKKAATYFAYGFTGNEICTDCGEVVSYGRTVDMKVLKTPKVTVKGAKKAIKVTYSKVKDAKGFTVTYKLGKKTYTKKFTLSKSELKKAKVTKTIKVKKAGSYKVTVKAFTTSGKKTAYSKSTSTKTAKVK